MSTNKLKGKDFITIGIFSAIYFVLSLVCNMLGGIHAMVWFLTPAIAAIVTAIPYLILNSKVKKPFAVLIMGTIVGLIYLCTGQFHIAVPATFIIVSIMVEIIRYVSKYQSFVADAAGFCLFSLGMAASPLPLWIDSKPFIEKIIKFGMPQSYIDIMKSLTSPSMLVVMVIATLIGGIIGAIIARAMFKKHFVKSGVIG